MKKKTTFNLVSATGSISIHPFENATPVEKRLEKILPTPPSEETIARLNAIAQEYPFCAYIKQTNLALL
ncbi:hypothetical protein A4H97_12855 [Niastella yeongjuensis]|uniref:Uncharacterized protein n=1 Tax=Niastella yeongjuensis TaxID=354355 RepID=A0A1V9EA92_9BACT|nr:hypothetical protein [Niastella yeongjuensis]OQP43030.1 hypothetical protein A4H97_12855 [Niastella yeongjuensis]SEO63807.1 hypothetical protein SAMN05660816_03241 [Niastella yeongjuensis]